MPLQSAVLVIVSGALLGGSAHIGMFITFRFFNGAGWARRMPVIINRILTAPQSFSATGACPRVDGRSLSTGGSRSDGGHPRCVAGVWIRPRTVDWLCISPRS